MYQDMGGRRPTILVVEDEALVRVDLAEALRDAGFDVIEVSNADEALQVLTTRTDILILVTDIEMPGSMDGVKLAHLVRDRWPPIHMIVMSGRKIPRSLPAHSLFFAKPYSVRELIEAAQAFLSG